jgi:hypothetical protein
MSETMVEGEVTENTIGDGCQQLERLIEKLSDSADKVQSAWIALSEPPDDVDHEAMASTICEIASQLNAVANGIANE